MPRQLAIQLITLIGITTAALIAAAEETTDQMLDEAIRLAGQAESEKAAALLDRVLEHDPQLANAYYLRGRERFRLGRIKQSVQDFDQYIKLRPDRAPRQWERGIALYYAGKFQEGAKQFELYQTYLNNDVENSVWRYMCVARSEGVAKARDTILPIQGDRRVPMMQVLNLYRGQQTPEQVLQAARQGSPSAESLQARLFYAHLYLGLYYEVEGNQKMARKYILLAADPKLAKSEKLNSYMWDVARIHADLLRKPHASSNAGEESAEKGEP